MGFWEQIPRLSPYFINNLLFLFPLFFFFLLLFNTTVKNVMAKSFQVRKVVWDPAHSESNVRPFLFL